MRRVEPLDRTGHSREGFDCGNADLNAFLQRHAAQQADKGLSRTFVLVDDVEAAPRPIIGYFTFRPYEIDKGQLPAAMSAGYTQSIGAYLLAKLAVSREHQGSGVGTRILHEVYRRTMALIDQGGGAGLFADAKDSATVPFYTDRGFTPLAPGSLKLFIPRRSIAEILKEVPPAGL